MTPTCTTLLQRVYLHTPIAGVYAHSSLHPTTSVGVQTLKLHVYIAPILLHPRHLSASYR